MFRLDRQLPRVVVRPCAPRDLRLAGDEENRFMGRSFTRVAEGEPTEVCFEVFARPLLGGDDISLTAECLSTDGLTIGVVEETNAGITSALKLCTVPPDGYFEHWCAAFAEQFVAESCAATHPEACIAARTECPEGDHPTEEEIEEELSGSGGAGTGGTGGTGSGASGSGASGSGASGSGASGSGSSASGGGSSEGDPESLPGSTSIADEDSSSDAGGCSVSRAPPGSQERSWVFWGVGLLGVFGRRQFKRRVHSTRP